MRGKLAVAIFATQVGAVAQASEPDDIGNAAAFAFDAVYTADVWRNARGGLRTGGVYLDNLDLTLSVDGERAWGIPGVSAFVYVLRNNDARFSERYVGDAMTVSNIDAAQALRLYEAWMEWESGAAQPLSFRFGLYDLNSEFDMSDSRSLFIHSSHGVGHELGQTGLNGPSIFPVTSLALRASWEPADNWRALIAVLDAVPGDPDDPARTYIHLSSEEGALGISEVQWSGGRVRKLSVGHWRYTAGFSDVRSTQAAPLPDRRDNFGSYAALEIAIGGADLADRPPWSAFVRYGVANGRINEFDDFLGVGVRRQGTFASRHEDQIGLAFSRAGISAATRDADASTGMMRERYEASVELTYRAIVNDWLVIQPDLQYIINPGADPGVSDSFAIGVRVELSMAAYR